MVMLGDVAARDVQAATSSWSVIAKGKAKVSGFCSGEPQRSGPQRKLPESLAAQTTGFGAGQTLTPGAGCPCPWRGAMLRIVRLAMETIIFSR